MSITRSNQIQCDGCGQFISIQDLMDEKASHHLLWPDSEFTTETFESFCPKCIALVPRNRS